MYHSFTYWDAVNDTTIRLLTIGNYTHIKNLVKLFLLKNKTTLEKLQRSSKKSCTNYKKIKFFLNKK